MFWNDKKKRWGGAQVIFMRYFHIIERVRSGSVAAAAVIRVVYS